VTYDIEKGDNVMLDRCGGRMGGWGNVLWIVGGKIGREGKRWGLGGSWVISLIPGCIMGGWVGE
jgi:hypothetical protein